MFLWYPVMDLARAPRRTVHKKGSGYKNGQIPPPWDLEKMSNFSFSPTLGKAN
jgi:hypothetical protein